MTTSILIQSFLKCESRKQLAFLLNIQESKLRFYAFSKKAEYKEFKIRKKDGSDRSISAPYRELKKIQRKLKIYFEEIYNPPASAYGFIRDRDYIKNSEQHLKRKSILNFDLEDFFPSIHAGRIYGLFQSRPFNFNKEVAAALTGLVTYKNVLPQGAPTSPILSNLIAFNMDKDFIEIAKKDRLMYTRYGDDITLSSRLGKLPTGYYRKIASKYATDKKINNIVENNGFKINPQKTRFYGQTKPHFVTGVKVNTKLNVNWKEIRQIRAMIYALGKFGPEAAQNHFDKLYNKGPSKNLVNVLRGKINHIKCIRGYFDSVYRKLFNDFVDAERLGRAPLLISEIDYIFLKTYVIKTKSNQGTGFILEDKYLITCAHIINKEKVGDEVIYHNYNSYSKATQLKGEIVLIDTRTDTMLIKISANHQKADSLSFTKGNNTLDFPPELKLKAIGFPGYMTGDQPSVINLKVSSSRFDKNDVKEIYVDRTLFGGMSGGPVLDTKNKVTGIISRGAKDTSTTNDTFWCVIRPLYYIEKAIYDYEKTLEN